MTSAWLAGVPPTTLASAVSRLLTCAAWMASLVGTASAGGSRCRPMPLQPVSSPRRRQAAVELGRMRRGPGRAGRGAGLAGGAQGHADAEVCALPLTIHDFNLPTMCVDE